MKRCPLTNGGRSIFIIILCFFFASRCFSLCIYSSHLYNLTMHNSHYCHISRQVCLNFTTFQKLKLVWLSHCFASPYSLGQSIFYLITLITRLIAFLIIRMGCTTDLSQSDTAHLQCDAQVVQCDSRTTQTEKRFKLYHLDPPFTLFYAHNFPFLIFTCLHMRICSNKLCPFFAHVSPNESVSIALYIPLLTFCHLFEILSPLLCIKNSCSSFSPYFQRHSAQSSLNLNLQTTAP